MHIIKLLNTAFCSLVIGIGSVAGVSAQTTATDRLFQYPEIPANLETLDARSDYFIEHFWDRANLKSAFSSLARMQQAFNDFTDLMPYANQQVVHDAINRLIAEVNKNPKNLLSLAEMAEGALYSDTAYIVCDECYLPFAQAVASNKKIPAAQRARFQYQANTLGRTQVGMVAPDFEYETLNGEKHRLSEVPAGQYVLLFFNDPDCDDCRLARIRLAADVNLTELIEGGLIKVLSIYPAEADDTWRNSAGLANSNWVVGASAEVDDLYDMRNPPVIYYLNGGKKILSKTFTTDNLLEAFRVVNAKMKAKSSSGATQTAPAAETTTETTEEQ